MNDNKAVDDDGAKLSELIDELHSEHHVWGSGLSPTWAGHGMVAIWLEVTRETRLEVNKNR